MNHITPQNIGFTIDLAPGHVMAELKSLIDAAFESPEAHEKHCHLVSGHIKKELLLSGNLQHVEDYVKALAYAHDSEYNYIQSCTHIPPGFSLSLGDVWVNFQEKGEFNPVHCHHGIYSFVFWVEVPYSTADEKSLLPEATGIKSGKFELLYTNTLGQICTHTIDTDKSSEGYVCIFPSNMRHLVYPFASSDKLRITVAGNLVLDDS